MKRHPVNFMMFRGGSSKGLYFNADELPNDPQLRDQILLDALGRDTRQIDGMGGGNPLTSKAALVSVSSREGCDLDYLFCQIIVGENRVDTAPNCGNILAGVGPFAIESGMAEAQDGETSLKIHMVNSGKTCEVIIQTPAKQVEYAGLTSISGVPGTAAPIICNYFDLSGSACGELFPTGNIIDSIDGVDVTCIDNGMPVVLIRAVDLGVSGNESAAELDADESLKARLQSIRLQLGPLMNLGDVDGAAAPKMCLISPPQGQGIVNTRTFIPYKCHVVNPGDAIIADDDGVLVVQRKDAPLVLKRGIDREQLEEKKRQKLAEGVLGLDLYDMRPRLKDEGFIYLESMGDLDQV